MSYIFNEEEESRTLEILESLRTAREAADIFLRQMESGAMEQFGEVAGLLGQLLTAIQRASESYAERREEINLPQTCRSLLGSFQVICACWPGNAAKAKMKLQFELIPTLEEAYMRFYYWAYVHGHPDREKRYYSEEIYELASNPYANEALETGCFKYDISFWVLAYNHLDYTKMCVESLLKNLPSGLNYELILWDNGSTDETTAYFESVRPTKLIESRSNWAIGMATVRAVEGRYLLAISNDVMVMPGAIENMLDCVYSDSSVAWVVPTTPNVSNYQAIPAAYSNLEEMRLFAQRNNVKNAYRREQRVRLCDPIALVDMLKCYSRKGICNTGYLNGNYNMFPDDRASLLLRRAGYKLMLAKDAYCYHFGSATLKDEIQRQNEQKFYAEGRRGFYNWFGIDPWGTGFCYDPCFFKRVVGEHTGHTEVLGINCGLGSNSLKIKEQIKEYCHNMDCTLTNITDDDRFLLDLKGISDIAQMTGSIKLFKSILYQHTFDYIVWETPFLTQYKFKTLIALCMEHLTQDGAVFLKQSDQTASYFRAPKSNIRLLENGWFAIDKAV